MFITDAFKDFYSQLPQEMVKVEGDVVSEKIDFNYDENIFQQFNVQESSLDALNRFAMETMDVPKSTPTTSSFIKDVGLPRINRLIYKTPLTESFEEFEQLENNLMNPVYNKRMVEELCRYKGICLQSSLSSMLAQLVSKALLKQFCFKGSKGKNNSGIQKRPFKHTLTYAAIIGNYINQTHMF